MGSRDLSGIPLEELIDLLAPLPKYRAAQIFKWIASDASSFDEMSNLPLELRTELAERYTLRSYTAVQRQNGSDGTVKLTIQLADGAWIEAVLLADSSKPHSRYTACLSTQAGCPAGCVFCKTGAAFVRNLNSGEIVEQFLLLRTIAKEAAALPIDNIVVMGMGEPLLNLGELRRALAVISDKKGMNFSRRRITISTCGIAQGIHDLAEGLAGGKAKGLGVRLAFSLTTADEALRRRLMPITAGNPLGTVKQALRHYQDSGGGRITLEAVLLGGINTRGEDAASIVRFAHGLDAAVNLIPWNPVNGLLFEGKPLREPAQDEVEAFTRRLEDLGLNVTRRYRRGRGVSGACGQLGS